MRKISIAEARQSLVEQIKEKLDECGGSYGFEEFEQDDVTVTLLTGQSMPCSCVKLNGNDQLLFDVSIVNVMCFEVGDADLTLESLDAIRKAIQGQEFTMDIWAADDTQESHTMLAFRKIQNMPDDVHACEILKEYIPCDWMPAPEFGEHRYIFYPSPLDKEHYLIAHFD